jgi:uncharacterized protein
MSHAFKPDKLAITDFAHAATALQEAIKLASMPRLAEESVQAQADALVHFQALGSLRTDAAGAPAPWVHLKGQVELALVCQRCLEPVQVSVTFARDFRFVDTEEQAEREDDESVEDVLVNSARFDLLELVEDELLMAIPPSPKHEKCPQKLKLSAADADFEAADAKPHPFAKLAQLKAPKS